MPEGTAIDLRASGVGKRSILSQPSGNPTDDDPSVDNIDPVFIMFTPEGRVARVSYNRSGHHRLAGRAETVRRTGRRQRVPAGRQAGEHSGPGGRQRSDAQCIAMESRSTTDEQRVELKEPINWLSGDEPLGRDRLAIGPRGDDRKRVCRSGGVITTYTAPSALSRSSEPLRTNKSSPPASSRREMANMGGR